MEYPTALFELIDQHATPTSTDLSDPEKNGHRFDIDMTDKMVSSIAKCLADSANSSVVSDMNADANKDWQTLAGISAELKKAETAEELATVFLKEILALPNGVCSTFYRVNSPQDVLAFWQGYPEQESGEQLLPLALELLGSVADTQEPVYLSRRMGASKHRRPAADQESAAQESAAQDIAARDDVMRDDVASDDAAKDGSAKDGPVQGEAVLLPMATSQGELIGLLLIELGEGQTLADDVLATLKSVVVMAADVLNRASIMSTLENLVAERTKELTTANARLLELDQLKTKFIQDISHEFRTPLTSIGLYLSLLEKELTDKGARHIEALKRQTTQLTRLVNAVLDISDPERLMGLGSFGNVNLKELLLEIVDIKESYAVAQGLKLTWALDETAQIYGNPESLQRLISNLIDNAISYTTEGTIHVSLTEAEDHACISVTDTGMGVPEQELEHIFDRFYRGVEVSQLDIPGSGLGLSMVQQIAEQHSGRVEVESAPEKGSTFRVWLPLAGEGKER